MTTRWVVGVAAIAIVAGGLVGCSGNSSNTSSPSGSSAASETTGPQQNMVMIDGQDQGAVQHVSCGHITDGVRLKISMGDHGVVAILSNDNPPRALGVQFSKTFQNGGVTLEYDSRKNEGNGEVTKQGNFYKITGTAVGKDSADSSKQVSKPFEVDVTADCGS
jgi:ipoprotein LpqH